jgi:transcription factor IIIB subunit 2
MAPPVAPAAKPRRRVKLPSLRNTPTPSARSTPAPETAAAVRKNVRQCPGCSTPDLQEQDGQLVCLSCGTVVSDSVIVNEITFGEASSGAPLVQGTTVHEGQRFAKTATTGFRRGGRTSDETHENNMRQGKDELQRLANVLQIMHLYEKATNLYEMARIHSFQRPMKENAAVALYVACRQTPGNTTMLIDFAEQIKMNVYDLGATYKAFVKKISMKQQLDDIPSIEIEPLLLKFAKRLEFGDSIKQVANDAAAILARMDRDWMVTGRQPMGLCGACLILAARMNNFRRSVREVVYVVKASDITIIKRLNEFQATEAGRLTVQDFRKYGNKLKRQADPPSLIRSREAKRQKQALELGEDKPDDEVDEAEEVVSRLSSITPALRRDADGFAIPNLPSVQQLPTPSPSVRTASTSYEPSEQAGVPENADEVEIPKPRRGRPPKLKLPPVEVRPEDLIIEGELEEEIIHIVEEQITTDEHYSVSHARAIALAEIEKDKQRRASAWKHKDLPTTEEIGKEEFEDDPEVANCLLDENEIAAKEQIWVTHNHDWLRSQQERILAEQLAEAQGKKKSNKPREKMARRGDGSVLGNTPVSSPAEASKRMLDKRANRTAFSKHLNYEKLKALYAPRSEDSTSGSPTPSSAGSRSRASSVASSVAESYVSTSRAPSTTVKRGRGRPPTKNRQTLVPATSRATASQVSQATAGATREKPVEIEEEAEISDAETIEEEGVVAPQVPSFLDDDEEEDDEEVVEEDYDEEMEVLDEFDDVDLGFE